MDEQRDGAGSDEASTPQEPAPTLLRPRLLDRLRQRFDVELTVIHAGAGYGKSTLLEQAVTENALDPFGDDVLIELRRRDRSPTQFLATLSTALTGSPEAFTSVSGVHEHLVARAPNEVALVLDDLHVLDESDSWSLVVDVLDALPTNGHLVAASRTMPDLGVRRRESTGSAIVIADSDLEFNDHELQAVAPSLATGGQLATAPPTWPALAVLSQRVGRGASIEYLWEVILAELEPSRRDALAVMASFERIDDELVDAVVGAPWTTSSLTVGLPLVTPHDDGVRLHDLLRDALSAEVTSERRRTALAIGAEALLDRGDWISAVECFRRAEATERLAEIGRRFASQAIAVGLHPGVAEALLRALPDAERNGALGAHLQAIVHWSSPRRDGLLEEAHERARAAGDDELAALTVWRRAQIQSDTDPWGHVLPDEMRRLAADGWPLAKAAAALASSYLAQVQRDVDTALAFVDEIAPADPATRRASRASRFVSLGHPERVEETLADVLASGVSEPVPAQACWLRGDIAPEDAWPLARDLPERLSDRLPDIVAAMAGIVTSVAITTGHLEEASANAETADRASRDSAVRVRHYAKVARFLTLLADGDERAAATQLDRMLAELPVDPFPSWPHLTALTPLRALRPELDWLDDIAFGPSLTAAVAAGRIVAALRSGAPLDQATELPWEHPNLLRVHVPPPMLAELAVAAADTHADAELLLGTLPHADRYLRRLADHPNGKLASRASDRVAGRPVPPEYDLSIICLGDLRVERSDGVELERLDRLQRPRRLLAELVVEGTVSRVEIAATMWPDLDLRAAANNLRVTLSKLIEVVDPDCGPEGSWWIRADRDHIRLHDSVEVDARRFDRELAAARDAEARGAPSVAERHYAAMVDLYGGDFLPRVDDVWVLPERLRLQSLAYAASCRRAELDLARGEPEVALRHATRAMRLDELGERALRLQIAAHSALGATGAARDVADRLRSTLASAGLDLSRETARVLEQYL